MPIREVVVFDRFNKYVTLPFELRAEDFSIAMQDIYDFLHDVNQLFADKGLPRLDDELRPAIMSGLLSDMLTASMAKHSRSLTQNRHFNGHPDLVVRGRFPNDSVKAAGADNGVEIKTTRKKSGAVDTHGPRDQWLCVFVYEGDSQTEPAASRQPMRFTEVYLALVALPDFRRNERGFLGTRTDTLDKAGVQKLRSNWIYKL